jgi:hypothetical protein
MANKAEKPKKDKGKDKGKGKGDAKTPAREAKPGALSVSLAEHPRAVLRIKQAKDAGGLAGFVLGAYLSFHTHTAAETGLRALTAGVACYVAVWAAAVFLWRHLIVAELRSREHKMLAGELAKLEGRGLPESSVSSTERTRARATS